MLKLIPDFIDAKLLRVLAAMGHGDNLVVVDRNFPAESVAKFCTSGELITLGGLDLPAAISGILKLLPLDSFDQAPLQWMDSVDKPGTVLPIHSQVLAACKHAEQREVGFLAIERFAFYEVARKSFAVVQTVESRPYGCFILKKGVVFDAL